MMKICTVCKKSHNSRFKTYCDTCWFVKTEKLRAKIEAGICKNCSSPVMEGFKVCEKHREHNRRSSHEREVRKGLQGICIKCKAFKMKNSRFCEICWVKSLVNKKQPLSNQLQEKLHTQNFKCFYTGVQITPGINASLDHVIPECQQGKDELDNLVWCDLRINDMKTAFTFEQFIKKCREISSRFPVELEVSSNAYISESI